ncbi:MAG: MATE family efflux transporter [Clostridiales bacterium]|nr:MATE family efflux transporter [Clostridiales bacterium]
MNYEEKKEFNKQLMGLAVPLALQNLLTSLVGASDALMLGRLTQESIAAVSLANQVAFVMSLFYAIAIVSASVLVSQYWGKKDYLNAKRFLGMAIRYAFAIGVIFTVVAYFFAEQLIGLMTPEEELIRIGAGYLRIVCFSYIFTAVLRCFLMIMKISGHAKLSVWISVLTVTVDMGADFFLIYGFGKIPALGANGSAYSTIAVEFIALTCCIIWAQRNKEVRLGKDSLFYFSRAYERKIWKIIPGMALSSLAWGLSIPMHSFFLGHLGTDATAAASVATVAQQLIQGLTHGLSTGIGIMIGKLLGQNDLKKAKKYGARSWNIALLSGLINVLLLGIAGPLVYIFYVLEPQAKEYLVQMLIFLAFYMVAFAYNTIITCGVFPAGGDSMYDGVSVLVATWCFAIPLALIACFVLHLPVIVVYVVMCLDEIVKVPFIKWRYNKYIWLKNLTEDTAG